MSIRKGDAVSPTEVVQRQLDAYNAHDLQAFLATYSEAATIFRMPSTQPMVCGKTAIGELYGTKVFNRVNHKADLLNRMALGNKVVDHERIYGLGDQPVEAVAVYKVENERIECVWLFPAE